VKIGDFSKASEQVHSEQKGLPNLVDTMIFHQYNISELVELLRENDWFLAWEAYEVIFHSARHSVRSDVWSFGTVMWEIFTNGRVPFGNMSAARIKRKVT